MERMKGKRWKKRMGLLRSRKGNTIAEVMAGMFLLAVLTAVFSKAFLASGQLAGRSARLLREDAEFCRDYYLDSELLEKEPAGTGEALFFVPEEGSEAVSDGGFSVRGIRLYRYTEEGKQGAVYDVGE